MIIPFKRNDMEERKRLTIDIPVEIHTKLKMFCAAHNISMRNVIIKVIDKIVAETNKQSYNN